MGSNRHDQGATYSFLNMVARLWKMRRQQQLKQSWNNSCDDEYPHNWLFSARVVLSAACLRPALLHPDLLQAVRICMYARQIWELLRVSGISYESLEECSSCENRAIIGNSYGNGRSTAVYPSTLRGPDKWRRHRRLRPRLLAP